MIFELEGSENGMSSSMGGGIAWVMREDLRIKWRLASRIRNLNGRYIHVAQKKKKKKSEERQERSGWRILILMIDMG